jgi:hypothetical protein
MRVISVPLLTLWMMLSLFGITLFGLTHLLCVGAFTLEVLRRPARQRRETMTQQA